MLNVMVFKKSLPGALVMGLSLLAASPVQAINNNIEA